jgi:hypothetical protein
MSTNPHDLVNEMIHTYVKEVGLTKEQTWDPEKKKWRWKMGSAFIDVFLERITFPNGYFRDYIRIFSALMEIPANINQAVFFRHLLEINDTSLGVKLTVMPNSTWVYATFERDVKGMDYEELKTTIYDLEWWADKLDDELKQKFAEAGSKPDRVM